MPLYHFDNTVSKIVRIRRLTTLLAQGAFRFKSNSRGAKRLVHQLRDFPNGDHDDGPDALEMALRLALGLLSQADRHECEFITPATTDWPVLPRYWQAGVHR